MGFTDLRKASQAKRCCAFTLVLVGHPAFLTVDGAFLSFSETLISLLVFLLVFRQRRLDGSDTHLFLCLSFSGRLFWGRATAFLAVLTHFSQQQVTPLSKGSKQLCQHLQRMQVFKVPLLLSGTNSPSVQPAESLRRGRHNVTEAQNV